MGIKIDIYPCEDEKNTVVIITFKNGEKHDVNIHEGKSMAESLVIAGVEHFFYHLDGVKVDGTNTIVLSDRIVYIKGNDVESFSEDAVRSNVMNLAKHRMRMS
jgi:1,4-alpha-glucan branching enzyme